jgi:hypothetical protein
MPVWEKGPQATYCEYCGALIEDGASVVAITNGWILDGVVVADDQPWLSVFHAPDNPEDGQDCWDMANCQQ